MQPHCRRSILEADENYPIEALAPLTSLNDEDSKIWTPLSQAGPNGMVSLLTLLVWWGRAIGNRTPFQIDSSKEWNATILDVTSVLLKLVSLIVEETISLAKRKNAGVERELEPKRSVNIDQCL